MEDVAREHRSQNGIGKSDGADESQSQHEHAHRTKAEHILKAFTHFDPGMARLAPCCGNNPHRKKADNDSDVAEAVREVTDSGAPGGDYITGDGWANQAGEVEERRVEGDG